MRGCRATPFLQFIFCDKFQHSTFNVCKKTYARKTFIIYFNKLLKNIYAFQYDPAGFVPECRYQSEVMDSLKLELYNFKKSPAKKQYKYQYLNCMTLFRRFRYPGLVNMLVFMPRIIPCIFLCNTY